MRGPSICGEPPRRLVPGPFLVGAALAMSLAAAGCGADDEVKSGEDELVVSAASSLTEALEAYGDETAIDERFSFAGSDELAAQIRKGAPVDVFASANTSLPEALFEEGLVKRPQVFLSNQLVLAVPRKSPLAELSAAEAPALALLADAAVLDIVIGAEGVPVGDYTREVLARLPEEIESGILGNVRSEEPEAKGIVGKLVAGAADAGFVYASDVEATDGELIAIELPPELEPAVSYGAAVVSGAENPQAAKDFVESLVEGEAHELLLDAGFLEPKGE